MSKFLTTAQRIWTERKGVAAVEFVLLSPIMLVLAFGLAEVYVEHATEDQFVRYVHQSGDLLSREPTLTSASIASMHSASSQMVKGFDSGRQIQLHVASFGFKADGSATLLWERSVGGAPITLNATDVEGMGTPTDTILRIEARMTYSAPFKYVWSSTARSTKAVSYFRPRETRAISMDGAISEYDTNWDYIPPSS